MRASAMRSLQCTGRDIEGNLDKKHTKADMLKNKGLSHVVDLSLLNYFIFK